MIEKRWMVRLALVAIAAMMVAGAEVRASGAERLIAVIEGNANPVPTADPCVLINEEKAAVLVWSFGKMEWASREVVSFCTDPDGAAIEGTFTLTAPNGDRISGTYETSGVIDVAANEITAVGRFVITHGTGRFAAARGKGALAAIGNLAPPFQFSGGLFGNISF